MSQTVSLEKFLTRQVRPTTVLVRHQTVLVLELEPYVIFSVQGHDAKVTLCHGELVSEVVRVPPVLKTPPFLKYLSSFSSYTQCVFGREDGALSDDDEWFDDDEDEDDDDARHGAWTQYLYDDRQCPVGDDEDSDRDLTACGSDCGWCGNCDY